MTGFDAVASVWTERLTTLRNVVRQELITRQLAGHVAPGMTVLDVGCGQGTQALRLAERGCAVTAVDPSADLLTLLRAGAAESAVEVEVVQAELSDLGCVLERRRFDVVCAHGLVMYLPDRLQALDALVAIVADGGALSVTFRNGGALAFRPAMRRSWQAALDAFDSSRYVNELGADARADLLEDVCADLGRLGVSVEQWYGVRVFTDPAAVDEAPPASADELQVLLAAEERAGRTDPYRRLASQLHVVGRRTLPTVSG